MFIAEFQVSDGGQVSLPSEVRRRWNMVDGGKVEVADLGNALLIVPAGQGGLKRLLRKALSDAGGYDKLAADGASDDPDLT